MKLCWLLEIYDSEIDVHMSLSEIDRKSNNNFFLRRIIANTNKTPPCYVLGNKIMNKINLVIFAYHSRRIENFYYGM